MLKIKMKGSVQIKHPVGGVHPIIFWCKIADLAATDHPFFVDNQPNQANYRTAGAADMAQAVIEGRPHRCNGEMALHVVEVMTGILNAGESGNAVDMTTTCDRPEPLNEDTAKTLLR